MKPAAPSSNSSPLGRRDAERKLKRLAVAVHGDRNRLVLIHCGAEFHLHPIRVVHGVEAANDVAGLKAGLRGRRAGTTHSTVVVLTSNLGTSLTQ